MHAADAMLWLFVMFHVFVTDAMWRSLPRCFDTMLDGMHACMRTPDDKEEDAYEDGYADAQAQDDFGGGGDDFGGGDDW